MKQTFAIANSSLSRRPNINIRPKTGQANSSCCHPEQAIFNSDIMLYAADNTVRAWAVKAWSREPISAMLPDKTIFISASRSRKIGAVNLFVSTDTFSEAAAKPFLPISKGIAKAIPATTSSFFTLNFKARQTGAVNQWVWAPSLINFENITMFVFTAWKQILSKSVLRARREGNLQHVSRSIFEGKIAESKFNDIQCFIVRRRKERNKKDERFQTVPGTPAKSFKCMCVSTGPSYHQNQFWAVVEKWWVPKNSRMIKLKPQTQLLCYQLLMFIGRIPTSVAWDRLGQNNHLTFAFTLFDIPVFPTPQYRKLQNGWDAGNSPKLYTMKSLQFLTLTSLYQKQQSSLFVKQTIRSTTRSSTVGCLPFSQPGESVPQCSLGTQCVGMTAPAGPVNLYHVRGRLASHFIVL